MSLRINHNIAALDGHNAMIRNNDAVSSALEKLSSGLRINRAADDAAGLIISEQMRAQIAGLDQAVSNSETAVSMVQTAEGALNEDNTLLNKARSLALHAANDGVNDQNQLVADQSELDNIISSVDRIANNTQFGTKKLLDGTLSQARANDPTIGAVKLGYQYTKNIASKAYTTGYYSLKVTTVATRTKMDINGNLGAAIITGTGNTIQAMKGTEQFHKTFSFSVAGQNVTVTSGTTKQNLLDELNAMGKSLGFSASVTGSQATLSGNIRLTATNYGKGTDFKFAYTGGATGASTIAGTQTLGTNWVASLLFNTGAVGATARSGTSANIVLSGNGGMTLVASGFTIELKSVLTSGFYAGVIDGTSAGATFQIGANVGQKATVELDAMDSASLGLGVSSTFSNLSQLKGNSLIAGHSDEALKVIDKAIDDITVTRGRLGAFQANTLESGLNSLRTTQENLTAAESTIRDVDFAAESAEFTKDNILVQASTAMLAQANQLPQNVLKLLA